MPNVYFSVTVAEDGSLIIPPFAARGLGYAPGDEVSLTVPLETTSCSGECGCDELFLGRTCPEAFCSGYTTDSGDVNLPTPLFARAGIPVGTDVYLLAGDGALVLVAGAECDADLAAELREFLEELGIRAGQPIPLRLDF